MKLQELNQNEMAEINGGGLLGNLLQGNIVGPLNVANILSVGLNTETGLSLNVNPNVGGGGLGGILGGSLGGLNLGNILGGLGGL
jgi:hypothetical protein